MNVKIYKINMQKEEIIHSQSKNKKYILESKQDHKITAKGTMFHNNLQQQNIIIYPNIFL